MGASTKQRLLRTLSELIFAREQSAQQPTAEAQTSLVHEAMVLQQRLALIDTMVGELEA
tara:strand:- start:264 stop:440 length:177 start_codon:yes stop_codon:yes gene_type:complete